MEQAKFKARNLDKSLFDEGKRIKRQRSVTANSDDGKRDRLQMVPFNLNTEARGRQRK